MKKLLSWLFVIAFVAMIVWLFGDNAEYAEAQNYGALSLRHIYSKPVTIVVDGANGTNTGVIPITISSDYGGVGSAWGSFCAFVEVDTLTKTGKTSAQDSLTIYYKELKSYTDATTYDKSDYDSTTLVSEFDWDHGYTKKLSFAPDICYGLEFRAVHATTISDSIQVTITLVYQ